VAVVVWAGAGFKLTSTTLEGLSRLADRVTWLEARTLPLFDNLTKIIVFSLASYCFLIAWDLDLSAWLASAGIMGIAVSFAAVAPVSGADIQETDVGIARRHERVESDLAAVVIAKGLLDPHEDARRAADRGCRSRRFGRPFHQEGILRPVVATWGKVGGGYSVARVEVRIKLAKARRAEPGELRWNAKL
jgi:hypothetical protein